MQKKKHALQPTGENISWGSKGEFADQRIFKITPTQLPRVRNLECDANPKVEEETRNIFDRSCMPLYHPGTTIRHLESISQVMSTYLPTYYR